MRSLLLVLALLAAHGRQGAVGSRNLPRHQGASADSSSNRRALISNGDEAPPGRWQYVCALGEASASATTVDFDNQACGASLIHPSIVLTAAHCAADDFGDLRPRLTVLCNSTLLGASGDGAQFRRVQQILLHPDSAPAEARAQLLSASKADVSAGGFGAGDLALALLDSPILDIPPVKVATAAAMQGIGAPGQELWVVGWGAVNSDRNEATSYPFTLREAALPLVPAERCEALYEENGVTEDGRSGWIDPNASFCAGYTSGVQSLPCEGDSGGPLLYAPTLDDPATHVQVGLVNGGAGLCGGPSLPAIFSRLDHYQSWIAAALAEVDSRASELDVLTGVGPGVAQAEQFVSRELGDGTASKQP